MATFTRTLYARNLGRSPLPAGVQLPFCLRAPDWDWANTSNDGRDVRISMQNPDGSAGTALNFWLVDGFWDQAGKIAPGFIKFPTPVPVGYTPLRFDGGNLALATASSYTTTMQLSPNDPNVVAAFALKEGSGTNLTSISGGFTGITNGTWVAGSPRLWGNHLVSPEPNFPDGNYLQLRASGSNYINLPNLFGTSMPPNFSISWEMRLPTGFVTTSNQIAMSILKFGTVKAYLTFITSPNRVQISFARTFVIGGAKSTTISDLPSSLGPTAGGSQGDGIWRWHTITGGAKGLRYYIDGVLQMSDDAWQWPTDPSSQDGTWTNAASVNFGCYFDPRPGNSSQFANVDIGQIVLHDTQLGKVQIDQLRHHVKLHDVSTAFTKLEYLGNVLPVSYAGSWDNNLQEPQPIINPTNSAVLSIIARGGVGTAGAGCRIVRFDSTDGETFGSNGVVLLGMGTGGESQSATNPYVAIDPISSKQIMMYSQGSNGGASAGLFKKLCYADAVNFNSFTSRGIVAVPAALTANYFSGNMAFWTKDSGSTWNLRWEVQGSGQYWNVISGTSSAYSGFLGIATNSLKGLWNSGTVSGSLFNGDSSGPDVWIENGVQHFVGHGSWVGSVPYHKEGIADSTGSGTSYAGTFVYDDFGEMRTNALGDYTTSATVQQADPGVIEFTIGGETNTFIYCDNLGGAVSSIVGYQYKGTISELFLNSVGIGPLGDTATGTNGTNIIITQHQGGTNNLQPKVNKVGQPNVTVCAYLQTDFDAGYRATAYVRDQLVTNSSGDWPGTMHLAAGTYAFTFNDNRDVYPPVLNVVVP